MAKDEDKKENRGRKSKLTQEFINKACGYLEDGNYVVTVCKLMGISEKTWYDWINQGIRDKEEGKTSLFSKLLKASEAAEAEAEARNVKNIKKAAETDWKASAWYLARKGKSKWLEKQTIELKTPQNIPARTELEAELDKYEKIEAVEVLEIGKGEQ